MMGNLQYITLTDPTIPAKPRHIAYYEWGDSNNPNVIMCLHGLSRNARDFDFLAKRLSTHYRVICPDTAGRGKSDWLSDSSGYNYTTYYTDTLFVLDALKLPSVTLIGTSMGGIVSMMIGSAQPARIKRIVLNDIGSIVSAQGLKRILAYVGSTNHFANAEEAMKTLRAIMRPFGIKEEAHWHYMLEISFVTLPDGSLTFAYDPAITAPLKLATPNPEDVKDVDLTAFWNALQCPVLIMRGKESDILSPETATSMSERPATKLVEWEGTGHAPALLENAQIETIINWLDNTA